MTSVFALTLLSFRTKFGEAPSRFCIYWRIDPRLIRASAFHREKINDYREVNARGIEVTVPEMRETGEGGGGESNNARRRSNLLRLQDTICVNGEKKKKKRNI